MALIAIGVSHQTASLDVRERLVINPSDLTSTLADIAEQTGAREVVVISTCNRTELYLVEGEKDSTPGALALLSRRLGDDATPDAYVRDDRDAVAHL